MNTIKMILALVVGSVAVESSAGDITGQVTLKGKPRPERAVDLRSDSAIAAQYPKGMKTRHYEVGSDGGLQHVLIYLQGDFTNTTFAASGTTTVLDHTNGLFQPYVVGVRVGEPLLFKCSDGTICSFHAMLNAGADFSVTPGRDTVSRTFAQPELPVLFRCDLHPWNSAYVGVFSSPYFAVTDAQGRFTIRGVPAGRYSVALFHPKTGTTAKPVVLADHPATVDFEVFPR
ncbi:MAG: carboxypeptidase regulatory-like domain-containing protein [Verrucomicrobiales bacterium]|nr:carboxypeptidase regulatory-like domain-containing protein [Verrucomicrobiales bacterium]